MSHICQSCSMPMNDKSVYGKIKMVLRIQIIVFIVIKMANL